MGEVVKLTVEGRVATMTLNRPDVLNTLNDEMSYALRALTAEVAADDSVRCLVVTGAGDHFMAGGERHPEITKIVGVIHEAISNLREMPKPVVASVSGAVAGFGVSLMSACDLVVAADNTKFASAYCHLGVSPDGGGTFFLPRMVGDKRAREIMFLGERITAQEALAMGLVNKVVAVEELAATTEAVVQRLVNGPQASIVGSKRLLNSSLHNTLEQQLLLEQESFANCAMTADFEEGVQAFIEKRPAKFS